MLKKILMSLVAMVAFGAMTASAQAVITFKKTDHNFGTFKEDDSQAVEFVFTNTGDKPLVVQQTVASCGCTIPSFSKEPIAPGKTGVIKVLYNGKGKFPGKFKKSISVQSNAANSLVRLYIEGDMLEPKAAQ